MCAHSRIRVYIMYRFQKTRAKKQAKIDLMKGVRAVKNMRKMQKIRLIAFLTSILSALSLLSTGFSAWYYVSYPSATTAGGSLTSYDVEDIEVSIEEFQVFDMSAFSFRETTENQYKMPSDEGKITLKCRISQAALANLSESFSVRFELSATALSSYATEEDVTDLFYSFSETDTQNTVRASAEVKTNTTAVTIDNNNTTCVHSAEDEKIIATCYFSNTGNAPADGVEFTLTFTLSIPRGDNFRSTFGKYISFNAENYTKFIVKAQVLS